MEEGRENFVSRLLNAALEYEELAGKAGPGTGASASWEEPFRVALSRYAVTATDGSSEDFTLFVNSAHLGYWVRFAEFDATEAVNVFDDAYVAELERVAERDPAEAIGLGMGTAADDLPAGFAPGTETWNELADAAMLLLDKRATRVLADAKLNYEADVDYAEAASRFSPEVRNLAFRVGYGMGMTVQSINIARLNAAD